MTMAAVRSGFEHLSLLFFYIFCCCSMAFSVQINARIVVLLRLLSLLFSLVKLSKTFELKSVIIFLTSRSDHSSEARSSPNIIPGCSSFGIGTQNN